MNYFMNEIFFPIICIVTLTVFFVGFVFFIIWGILLIAKDIKEFKSQEKK